MRILQTIRLALKNIVSNKMRSILTMIGIIIGISSVIILVSLVSGSTKSITDQVQSLGTNLISVSVNNNAKKKIQLEDMDEIKAIAGVKQAAPSTNVSATVKNGKYSQQTSVTGTTASFMEIRGMKIAHGRFLSDLDMDNRNKVAVLGSNIAQELFGVANPVNQEFQVNGNSFKVVGVLEAQGSSMGSNTDDLVIIPVTRAVTMGKNRSINTIFIEANSDSQVDTVKNTVDAYFNRKLKSGDNKTYNIMSQKQLLDTMGSITQSLTLLLAGIAAISLVVGGIGVMNVMLVSVSERTKEIGIRKAMGGKRRNILFQFLVEALVLSSLGGVLGILLGVGVGSLMKVFGLTAVFSPQVILLSFSFSMAVGLVFGIFPAYKASKLRPIDALRYE